MGEVLFPRVVQKVTEPGLVLDPVFSNNTWGMIIRACQKNEVPTTWTVGAQKTVAINGVDYVVDIIGKNHDDYADGSGKAPLTFQMHDCYGTAQTMNSADTNVGGWRDTPMRKKTLPDILTLMPAEFQSGIREVSKKTSAGNMSESIITTADKLFLLSTAEVVGDHAYAFSGEGDRYEYYIAGNSDIKSANGEPVNWSVRSPYVSDRYSFCYITYYGGLSYYESHELLHISFAFCF